MSPPPAVRAEADQLNDIAMFISTDFMFAFQGAVVMGVAMQTFHRAQQIFATNPANVLAFVALRALEDRSIVNIADALKDDNNLYPAARALACRQDLINHRDAVSHPYLLKWGRAAMRTFAAAHRQWLDHRMLLVWEMRADLYRRLGEKARREAYIPGIGLQATSLLRSILVSSFKPEQLSVWSPTEADVEKGLVEFRDAYVEFLDDKISEPAAEEAAGQLGASQPSVQGSPT